MKPPIPSDLIRIADVLEQLIELSAPGLFAQVRADSKERYRLKREITRLEGQIAQVMHKPRGTPFSSVVGARR